MNKILDDYISCVRKRLITSMAGDTDAAVAFAESTWRELTSTPSRTLIRDTPALREALAVNGLSRIKHDARLREHLREIEING